MWNLVQAAKYLGVAPWRLRRQSAYWTRAALLCLTVEADVAEVRATQAKRPSRLRDGPAGAPGAPPLGRT